MGHTDEQTDGRIAVLLNAPPRVWAQEHVDTSAVASGRVAGAPYAKQ